ncbi:Copia protein [Habropoda laboriosa]|uniref:Copia protein n=1 Tax=Habropoda laboriosa TaxID=597456 RepID=A0A0L7QYC7_9HYME|nr:Copia protein [Habropoda laboriosa]
MKRGTSAVNKITIETWGGGVRIQMKFVRQYHQYCNVLDYVSMFKVANLNTCTSRIKLPDDLLSIMLLASLRAKYDNFSVAIESRDECQRSNISRQNSRKRKRDRTNGTPRQLIAKKIKQRRSKTHTNNKQAKPNNTKYKGKCYNCGKLGHISRYCKSKTKRKNFVDAMTAIAFTKRDIWCLDSGATRHMCSSRNKFSVLERDASTNVYTAADQCVKSRGEGKINLSVKANLKDTNTVKLSNVIYVPELRNNLLSVSAITDKGYHVKFGPKGACVKRANGTTALTATKKGQLYLVNETSDHTLLTNDVKDNLLRWHQRYGHLNVNDLNKLKLHELVADMNLRTEVASTLRTFKCE